MKDGTHEKSYRTFVGNAIYVSVPGLIDPRVICIMRNSKLMQYSIVVLTCVDIMKEEFPRNETLIPLSSLPTNTLYPGVEVFLVFVCLSQDFLSAIESCVDYTFYKDETPNGDPLKRL